MKDNYIVGVCLLVICSTNSMEKENEAYTQVPIELFETSIIPYIITLEKKSVKQACCDLYYLGSVNKQTRKFIRSILEKKQFTQFFIDSLATMRLLASDQLAIAAHLGTKQSMKWIKEYLEITGNLLSYQANSKLIDSVILLDDISETDYLLNAHKLLFHLANIGLLGNLELIQLDEPSITSCYKNNSKKRFLRKLEKNNTITKKIVSLLLDENFINDVPNQNGETLLMYSLRCHRTDLLPLFFDEKSINHQNKFGQTPLMYAVKGALDDSKDKYESLKGLEFILSKNPDVELRDKNNFSAFNCAYFHLNRSTQHGRYIMQKLREAQEIQYQKSLQDEKLEE